MAQNGLILWEIYSLAPGMCLDAYGVYGVSPKPLKVLHKSINY